MTTRYFTLTPPSLKSELSLGLKHWCLLAQVPTFADEARLSVELDSKEPPKEHVKIPRLGSHLLLSVGTETLAWMKEAEAWPSALTTGRRRLYRFQHHRPEWNVSCVAKQVATIASHYSPPNICSFALSLAPTRSPQSTGWRGPRQQHEPQRQCAGWRGPTRRHACHAPFGGRRAVRPTPAAATHRLNLHRTTQFRSSISSDTACHSLRLITLYPSNSLSCQVRGYRLAHQSSVDYPSRAASLEKRASRHARPGARPVAAADAPSRRWRLFPAAIHANALGCAHEFAAAGSGDG